jgi:hypothetical protein
MKLQVNPVFEAQSLMEPLQSIKQTAAILGLSPWTVISYLRQGKIKPVRLGRRVLIEPSEIARVIEAGRTNTEHEKNF